MTPDATGTYEDAGEFGGQRYYRRQDAAFYLWWGGEPSWYISTAPGVPGLNHWVRLDPNIEGDYDPGGAAIGVATVTEI